MHDAVRQLRFALLQAAAAPETIDALEPGPEWTALRVAPDEALWLGPAGAQLRPELETAAQELEPGAFVGDVTDGWNGVVLSGPERRELLARLSPLSLPEPAGGFAFVQGDVLGISGKLVVLPEATVVLWPATFSAYVGACMADVGAVAGAAELDWADCAPRTTSEGTLR